ncbi:hypothetical protein ACPV5S_15860 [Vibrio astriarenae]
MSTLSLLNCYQAKLSRHFAALLLSLSLSLPALSCTLDGSAFFQTLGTMPQGTFSVALAINDAKQKETLTISSKHSQRLDMIMWQMQKQLEPHYKGEVFDVSLYEISGNHFIQLTGNGETVTATAHLLPKENNQAFIVSDASVLFALANQSLSFTKARELGLWQSHVKAINLDRLLFRAFS